MISPTSSKQLPVIIEPYDPAWENAFVQEDKLLRKTIGVHLAALEHIGSTSVPGLAAKPIIDILAGLNRLEDSSACIPLLVEIGYRYIPEYEDSLPERRYFERMKPDQIGYHLHMVEVTSPFYKRHIAFRDYLRAHPETAAEYADLKIKLAAQFGPDREGYTDAKTAFIQGVERLALK